MDSSFLRFIFVIAIEVKLPHCPMHGLRHFPSASSTSRQSTLPNWRSCELLHFTYSTVAGHHNQTI